MTHIVTVSAATAAYAAEPIKPAQRVNGGQLMDAAIRDWAEQARKADDPRQQALINVVRPPALALYLLTALRDRPGPQTSRQQAEAAYLDTMAMALPDLAEADGGEPAARGDRIIQSAAETTSAGQADHRSARPKDAIADGLEEFVFLPRV